MDKKEFIDLIAYILKTQDELTLDTELASYKEWDSLSAISFISLMSVRRPNVIITPDLLKNAKTVRDLYELIDDKNVVAD